MPTCPSCKMETAAGRWCSVCHRNLQNPELGRLVSPAKRLGAFVLDIVLFFVLMLILRLFFSPIIKKESDIVFLSFLVLLMVELLFFSRGTTLGKMVLGMRVVKTDGRRAGFFTMLFRELIGKSISGFFFSLGFLWILLDRERQGWHDKLASTYVVER
ncbi:RDD family protein [Caldimicrobium thiodismutans]|uniref:RDD family protein n=1 Tax=Caldimicrobium thiodismutans TaxID=1653476 RepID=UPI0008390D5C|nr:RDD family protein [Caldimicrobium thiodismutans]